MREATTLSGFEEREITLRINEIALVLRKLRAHFGDLQLVSRSVTTQSLGFDDGTVEEGVCLEDKTQVLVRRCGPSSTPFVCHDALDLDVLVALLESAPASAECYLANVPLIGQHSAGLDVRLHRQLAERDGFYELADAIRSNIAHERERCPSKLSLAGRVMLWRQLTFASSGAEVVGAFQGALESEVGFGGAVGDTLTQVHAPESFLPIALMGARVLQRYAHLPILSATSLASLPKIILHPRALESAIRQAAPSALRAQLLAHPASVQCPGLFLVDDPTIEGLWTARGFDDTGTPTGRQAFVLRGQVAERVLSSPTPGQQWLGSPLKDNSFSEGPSSKFSGVLVGRGEVPLQELLRSCRMSLIVNRWSVFPSEEDSFGFVARVEHGVVLRGERAIALVEPGALKIRGRLFGEGGTIFSRGSLSRELQDTGSAVAPFVLTNLSLDGA